MYCFIANARIITANLKWWTKWNSTHYEHKNISETNHSGLPCPTFNTNQTFGYNEKKLEMNNFQDVLNSCCWLNQNKWTVTPTSSKTPQHLKVEISYQLKTFVKVCHKKMKSVIENMSPVHLMCQNMLSFFAMVFVSEFMYV